MEIIRLKKEIKEMIHRYKSQGKTVGFVPTMGYLHEGHLSLIKRAREENDLVVVSIFVNPLQFGPNEDFEAYPRDLKRDEKLAKEAGADLLFYPSVEEMYPSTFTTQLRVIERVDVLCGSSRPGHFDGVVTVVLKLLNIVGPDRAYFGMKDAQQVAVINGLIEDYDVPVKLIPVETVREEDGLAKSSRNVYLTENERRQAPNLYQGLQLAKQEIESGTKDIERIKEIVHNQIQLNTSGIIDYIDIYSYPQLKDVEEINRTIIIAIAVKFSKARLIDNIII